MWEIRGTVIATEPSDVILHWDNKVADTGQTYQKKAKQLQKPVKQVPQLQKPVKQVPQLQKPVKQVPLSTGSQ